VQKKAESEAGKPIFGDESMKRSNPKYMVLGCLPKRIDANLMPLSPGIIFSHSFHARQISSLTPTSCPNATSLRG
jgi:hypothetical protein